MNLNPFIRIKWDCPVSMEQAWERLLSVTKEQSMMGFFGGDAGWGFKDKHLRYLGRLDKFRFTLVRRKQAIWNGLPYYRHQSIVLKGNIEGGGSGCVVSLSIRPMLQIMFAWLACVLVFAGLLVGMYTTGYAEGEMFVGMAACVLVFWVLSIMYRKEVRQEREFLEVLFGGKQQMATPQMVAAIG